MSDSFDPSAYLDWFLGTVLAGLGITAALFGFATAQFGYYLVHYWPDDRPFLRTIVASVWALDGLHLGLYCFTMYDYVVNHHGSFAAQGIPWTSTSQILVNACLIAIVQGFYIFRVWGLSRKHIDITIALGIVSAADFIVAVVMMTKIFLATTLDVIEKLHGFVVALSSVTATADILLTITLVVLLLMSKTRGSRNKRLIHRLMFYPINTGLLTSCCAILTLVTSITEPATNLYIVFYYIGARLYTVCMIANLNARESLRAQMAAASGITTMPLAHENRKPAVLKKRYSPFTTQRSSGSGSGSGSGGTVDPVAPVLPPVPRIMLKIAPFRDYEADASRPSRRHTDTLSLLKQ